MAVFGAIANQVIASGRGEHDFATIVSASTGVFIAVAVAAALMVLASLWLPRGAVDAAAYSADAIAPADPTSAVSLADAEPAGA